MHNYAYMFFWGYGGDKDHANAKSYFKLAADKGCMPAAYFYALQCLVDDENSLEAQDYIATGKEKMKVLAFLKKALKQGSIETNFFQTLINELSIS